MMFNEQQQQVIDHTSGNIAVISAAGSGKTSVITYRIKALIEAGVEPATILAITFNADNRKTLQDRLNTLIGGIADEVNIETFHSFALKVIQTGSHYKYSVWTKKYEKDEVLKEFAVHLNMCSKYEKPSYNAIWAYMIIRRSGNKPIVSTYTAMQLERIYKLFEEYKRKNNLIEFDDFLPLANKLLSNNTTLLHQFQGKAKYILADEYQDVSVDQAKFLYKLNTTNTMVVGDPMQAIYSFRGGNSKYMLNFYKDYNDVTVVNMNINYRCNNSIISASNKFAHSAEDSNDVNYKDQIGIHDNGCEPSVVCYNNQFVEANDVCEHIITLVNEGRNYSDIMIMARTNAQLQMMQSYLTDYDIPFEATKAGVFTEQPEIKLLLSYLRLAVDDNNDEAFMFLYNKPNRWLGAQFIAEVTEHAKQKNLSLYKAMDGIARRNWRYKNGIDAIYTTINYLKSSKSVIEKLKYLRESLKLDEYWNKGDAADDGSYGEKTENMDTAISMWSKYANIEELVKDQDKVSSLCNNEGNNAVKVLTVHRAKGMESKIVFLIGCNHGFMPHHMNLDSEDEKHIMYVAMTRAKEELHISWVVSSINENVSGKSEYLDVI